MPNDADSLTESDEDATHEGFDDESLDAPPDDLNAAEDIAAPEDRAASGDRAAPEEEATADDSAAPDEEATAEHQTVHADDLDDSIDGPDSVDAATHNDHGDGIVTLEDLGGADADFVTVEDLDGETLAPGADTGAEVLFDGDPEEFELDFGPAPYPDARPSQGDLLVFDEPTGPAGPPPRRMSRMERRRRVRLQARRVRRIIRHIEPWSVLKISIFFYACLWVIFLVAGFMIWGVAESSGTVDKLENLIRELFALETFDFDAGQIFRGYALGGLALAIAGTTFNVLMCLLFNLISDLTGGLRITMIEEETARPTPPRRRRRRPPSRR